LLVQCGHDVAEALRRMSLNVVPLEKSLSVWSEDETLKFEMGLLISGKNFHAIQKEVLFNFKRCIYFNNSYDYLRKQFILYMVIN